LVNRGDTLLEIDAGAVGALLGGAVWLFVRNPKVGVYALWVFIALAPTSSLVPIASEVGAERRMYLPLIGILTLVALGVTALWRRRGSRVLVSGAFTGGVVGLAVILGVATAARTREYASPLTIARTVLERWPTASAHQMVGTELVRAGAVAAAIPHLRAAAEAIAPARFNLGQALLDTGNVQDGIVELERFVREEPNQVTTRDARLLLARAYTESGRADRAIDPLEQILRNDASDVVAHGLLAEALAAGGHLDAAIPHYRRFVAARPEDAGGWTGLGIALISTDRPIEAIEAFGKAVAAAPGDAGFRVNLARALLGAGRTEEAREHLRVAAVLSPGDPAIRELIRAAGGG
jgi:tetratricopeptide (TPR) repeat protein